MSRIKDALTRKFGPLPAWAWAIIAFALVWYYRRKFGGGPAGLSTSSNLPANANAQQSPVVLGPGESAYDPNTGQLVSAPGGNGTGGFDMGQALEDLAAAIESGTTTNSMPGAASVPATREGTKHRHRRHRGKRANKRRIRRLLFGRSKRPRSAATVVHPGRPQKPSAAVRARRRTVPPAVKERRRERQRATHRMRRRVVRQHHETSMPKAKRPEAHVPPRPSSPPRRTHRRHRKR